MATAAGGRRGSGGPRWPVRGIVVGCLLLTAALAGGCGMGGPDNGPGEGPGKRQQPLALSPGQELAVGRRAYDQVMTEVRDHVLPASSPEVVRVRRIVAKLIKAAEIEPLQREIYLRVRGYRFEWEANVVRDPQINAFCLPAGKIFVYTGILPVTAEDDDFLATVLSHEMAHALAHHASERVAREKSGGGVLRSLQYDRMQESEADHIGVFLMAFAGFDANQAPKFWERMLRATENQGRRPEFLSDHPSPEHRIRDLQKWAPEALRAKQAFDRGQIAPAGR